MSYDPSNFRVIECTEEKWRTVWFYKKRCHWAKCWNRKCTFVHIVDAEYERLRCDARGSRRRAG